MSTEGKPRSPKGKPKSPKEEPKSPKEEPKSLKEEPKSLKEEPKSLKEEPKSLKEEPKSTKGKPRNMTGHPDLVVATAAALILALIALFVPLEIVQVLAAVPLCLLLPGYAITAASFERLDLPPMNLLLLSVALSLATLTLGALALTLLPGGIRAGTWAALLVLVVLGGCIVAGVRRPAGRSPSLPMPRVRIGLRDASVLALAGVATIAALVLASTPLGAKNAVGFTQLWMLPSGTGSRVQVGVKSEQKMTTAYRVELRSKRGGGALTRRLVLQPGEEKILRLRAPGTGLATARLYRRGDPAPMRWVTASVQVRRGRP
jgi:hypothetical protein